MGRGRAHTRAMKSREKRRWRRRLERFGAPVSAREVGQRAITPKQCRCCVSDRKYSGAVTLDEQRAAVAQEEQQLELEVRFWCDLG